MTILNCLKTSGTSLNYGTKFLIFSNGVFRVYADHYEKRIVLLLETDNEALAVEELMR